MGYMICKPHLPVPVPFAKLIFRNRVNVGQGDDVSTVSTEPLLIKSALPVLQLVFILVGDTNVSIVTVPPHACDSWVIAFQEVQVNLLVALKIFILNPSLDTIH